MEDLNNIIETYKSNNTIQHLHIFSDESIPKPNLQPIEIIKVNNLELYKYNSKDFKKNNIYAWNDGTHIIDLNLINRLLNIDNMPDTVWQMEIFLKNIYDNNVFYRWGSNKILFKASNLFGKNVNKHMLPIDNLKRFFGETENWKDIIRLIINK